MDSHWTGGGAPSSNPLIFPMFLFYDLEKISIWFEIARRLCVHLYLIGIWGLVRPCRSAVTRERASRDSERSPISIDDSRFSVARGFRLYRHNMNIINQDTPNSKAHTLRAHTHDKTEVCRYTLVPIECTSDLRIAPSRMRVQLFRI